MFTERKTLFIRSIQELSISNQDLKLQFIVFLEYPEFYFDKTLSPYTKAQLFDMNAAPLPVGKTGTVSSPNGVLGVLARTPHTGPLVSPSPQTEREHSTATWWTRRHGGHGDMVDTATW